MSPNISPFFFCLLLLHIPFRLSSQLVCDVTHFGASGDGFTYDTLPIQLAIDSCSSLTNPGDPPATVLLPSPGRFLSGTLFLRNRTFLHISPGASLLASPLQSHYPTSRPRWYLVLAENASDVGVTGSPISATAATPGQIGIIDGQSSLFVQSFSNVKNVMVSWNQTGDCYGDECRPRLIGFVDCQRVKVWDIALVDPAYWCLHIVRSNDISIHHISVSGDFYTPNNDGIDIDSSNNTSIHDCHIDTGDDAICPKTTYGPLHNLTASHCWIRTKSCAVKFGSRSDYDFHGLSFHDIQIVESHRGLGLQLRDSGNISDVVFSNINITTRYYHPSWWGRAEPIYVTSCPRTTDTIVGRITRISFTNINAVSENGIFLSGVDGGLIKDITMTNLNLHLQRATNYSGGLLDYRPGCRGLVQHQNSGLFINEVTDLYLENVRISFSPDMQPFMIPIEFYPPFSPDSTNFVNFSLTCSPSSADLHNPHAHTGMNMFDAIH